MNAVELDMTRCWIFDQLKKREGTDGGRAAPE
jgi:hypothetical protein